ncbi:sorting nexin-5-like isoform X2 [Rhopilema esculentum]|uniref:sorting nexin-5-like isoform X2 n=1 Tax=Rhopilema esculentum TaxID=499914 RepID=UPI0031CF8B0B
MENNTENDGTTNADTEQEKPFINYDVDVLDASKDGEAVTFTIQTKTEEDDSEKGVVVLRQYEDFEYLSHCLAAHNDILSVVVPVLPPKPVITPSGAEAKTKKQLGKESKTMIGDDFTKDCKALQKYLQLVIAEKKLNGDETLKEFLTKDKAPVRANVKKGLFTSLKGALDDARFHNHKDIDDEFQSIRTTADHLAFATKNCNECYKKTNLAEQRFAHQISNFTSVLRSTAAQDETENDLSTHMVKFAGYIDEYKKSLDKTTEIQEDTFGFTLDLYSRYLDSAKETLLRRTCKLVEFENASKALDKAKPKNLEQLQIAKNEAEKVYEETTEHTRDEIKKFHNERVLAFKDAMSSLAERQIENSTKMRDFLSQAISELQDL